MNSCITMIDQWEFVKIFLLKDVKSLALVSISIFSIKKVSYTWYNFNEFLLMDWFDFSTGVQELRGRNSSLVPRKFYNCQNKTNILFMIFFSLIFILTKKYARMNVWMRKLLQKMHHFGYYGWWNWRSILDSSRNYHRSVDSSSTG